MQVFRECGTVFEYQWKFRHREAREIMGYNQKLAERVRMAAQGAQAKKGFWESTLRNISNGNVTPVISGSFRLEQIFRELAGETAKKTELGENDITVFEMLVKEWSASIDYPMQDDYIFARVAQYYLVEQKDDTDARREIVNFLKTSLLAIASDEPDYSDVVEGLENQIQEMSFSEIVRQLDYPRYPETVEDPVRLLARFPIPIYITTGQTDFLERALKAENKEPHTQICFWSGNLSNIPEEHRTDPNFVPDINQPLVYHLYGLENYPQTLVLSEDDYINFLVSTMENNDTTNPIVPYNIRKVLGESQLLLLGYRLSEWDFRVLFRFILKFRNNELAPRGMMIQLKQTEKETGKTEKTLSYLGRYLDRKKFDVEWNDAEAFIQKLWHEWEIYRQNQ
jgi:hypothetical protein